MTLLAALCGGSMLFLASYTQQCGIELTANPGRAGFITGLYTVLTPILYFLFFRRRSGMRIWVGAVLATVGLYLLCFDGTPDFRMSTGDLLILLCALFWAWHVIVIDLFAASVNSLWFACGQFFVCGMLNLAVAFATGEPTWAALYEGRGAILFCGILSTGIGFTGQIIGQKIAGDPTRSAILLSTESLFSAIGGIVWNLLPIGKANPVDSSMNLYAIAGCAIIFASVILSQLPDHRAGKAAHAGGADPKP